MLHGISIARDAPLLTHLFFADDSIIFTRASVKEVDAIKDILRHYDVLSGQKVNIDKSEISFSRKLGPHIRHLIDKGESWMFADALGVERTNLCSTCFGIVPGCMMCERRLVSFSLRFLWGLFEI